METTEGYQQETLSDADSDSAMQNHDGQVKSFETRAYQLEMFQRSMESNIIVTMDTGRCVIHPPTPPKLTWFTNDSGKTWIAKLRIEAELFRTPSKFVWFTAPSVVLAEQQHVFLSRHLPQHAIKLITGSENIHLWSTQEIWDAALLGQNIIVSTPQILLEGLTYGFIQLQLISLLVIDEAHNGVAKAPSNMIMQSFYHPLRALNTGSDLPHILGLTASPITTKLTSMEVLEKNLNAVCMSPTQQIEEYRSHVNLPEYIVLNYPSRESQRSLPIELSLQLVETVDIYEDPWIKKLENDNKPNAPYLRHKALETRSTYCQQQLKKLQGNIQHLYEQLGPWATNNFLREVLLKLQSRVESRDWLSSLSEEENRYLNKILGEVRELACKAIEESVIEQQLSSKADCLVQFLAAEYVDGSSCVIFTERRSTCIALSNLLQSHPLVQYTVASFVGASNAKKTQDIVDIANPTLLKTELEEFRIGKRSCVVATSVMEEGIDVSATSLVIRFDDSKTVRSYIQSRGRARKTASKFVVMRDEGSSSAKYLEWATLEAEMKNRYMDEMRLLDQRLKLEEIDEYCCPVYIVESTGARLTMENARSHLEHFCQSLRKLQYEPNPRPTFICHGMPGLDMTATVTLPSSLPKILHQVAGSSVWRTEKAAKRDAAFVCLKLLHQQGLINDHLLPPSAPRRTLFNCEVRAAFTHLPRRINPWQSIAEEGREATLHTYSIELENAPFSSTPLVLLLPTKLTFDFKLPLYFTQSAVVLGKIEQLGTRTMTASLLRRAKDITLYLIDSLLAARCNNPESWAGGLPFFILPNIEDVNLDSWLDHSKTTVPLTKMLPNIPQLREPVIVKPTHHPRPYLSNLERTELVIKRPSLALRERIPAILAQKIPKRVDYLTKSNAPASVSPRDSFLAIQDCTIESISPATVWTFQLMPSVIRIVEFSLVSTACCSEILQPFQISNERLVMEALVSPLASSWINYERLEFLGDTLLKLYAFLQVFTNFQNLPEHYLTIEATKIVNNARLYRAAIEIGLDRFVIHEPFIPKRWKPEIPDLTLGHDMKRNPEDPQASSEGETRKDFRQTSTKVVADHVEALLAVAYLDKDGGDGKATAFLRKLLPEIQWESPTHNAMVCRRITPDSLNLEAFCVVEAMIGYRFKQRRLLVEALNHSSVNSDIPTYGRLEFLGDAVLQRIVNEAVYMGGARYSQKDMHLRQIACVNHAYLAFLCFDAQHDVEKMTVSAIASEKTVEVKKSAETKYLWQFMAHSSMEIGVVQQRSLKRYLECHANIQEQLSTSKTYPWTLLASIAAPKFFSDIIESVLASIYIDSGADLEVCIKFLTNLGLMRLLGRLVSEPDMVLAQPKTILWEERAKAGLRALKVKSRTYWDGGIQKYGCQLLLQNEEEDDEIYVEIEDAWCAEEAVLKACDIGLEKFRSERRDGKDAVGEGGDPDVTRENGRKEAAEGSQRDNRMDDENKKRKRDDESPQDHLPAVSDDDSEDSSDDGAEHD